MSAQHGPGTDPALPAALRRLGEAHEPDSAGLWARVDPARGGEAVRVDTRRRDRIARARASRTRPGMVAGLAAASVLSVLVGTQVAGTFRGDDVPVVGAPSTGSTSAAAPSTAAPPSTRRPATAVATPSQTRGTRSAATGRRPSSGPSRTSRTSGPAAPPSGTAASPARTTTTSSGTFGTPLPTLAGTSGRLSLSTRQYLDWVLVGARQDGVTVRAKRPVGGWALSVRGPYGARPAPGPMSVTWTDGMPEQTGSTSSWSVGFGGSWTVTIAGADVPRRLQVWLDPGDSLRLKATSTSGRGVSAAWSGGLGRPSLLSLDVPGGVGDVTVTLTGSGRHGTAVSAAALVGL